MKALCFSSVFVVAATISNIAVAQQQAGAPDPKLVVVSYGGGTYQDSHKTAFINPYCAAHGLECESVAWNAEYGRLAQMVRSGRVTWDVVEVTAAQYARGKRDNLFARLTTVPDSNRFRPLERGPKAEPYGIPNVYWSTALGFRADQFGGNQPKTWRDFWDTQRFPGARALYDSPRGNLEFALLASGVPLDRLYPLDVERAFAKLDSIRDYIRVWWSDGTEPVNLLLTRQVALTSVWTGRVYGSETARHQVLFSWFGAAHELDYWIVPRGSRRTVRASDFIGFASEPQPMARQAELTAYGPSNALALRNVNTSVLPMLPTSPSNWSVSFVIDSDWWSQHEQAITARWVAWKNRGRSR